MMPEQDSTLNLLLVDDDTDDCSFFDKALKEIPIATNLTTLHDGEQLMNYLIKNSENLPDVLFLDLSMPRKNGFECLTEIKQNEIFKDLVVILFSTSYTQDSYYEQKLIDMLFKIGANEYIRKPNDFVQLKQVIHNALVNITENKLIKE